MSKTKDIIVSKVNGDGEFVPPDGGWGWAIVFAAGFSNLSALPILQQFGLLFRDKFERLGITSSQTTTIINMNSALTSCVGLANGPVFKTFTYRQVSLTGAIFVFISLILTTFSNTFITFLLSFSILYGASYGISSSANALALNTYWKNKRRLATGLSWTTTGLGPILWPHIITSLFAAFGETGAILIITGVSLHAIACALLLQPVEWHGKKPTPIEAGDDNVIIPEIITSGRITLSEQKLGSGYFSSKLKYLSAFSSQYLYNEDDPVNPGYEITDPGIPMMLRSNDGYFSQTRQSRSRLSSRDGTIKTSKLNSKRPSISNLLTNCSRKTSTFYLNDSKKNSFSNLGVLAVEREIYKPTNLIENRSRKSSTFYLNESKKNSSDNLRALAQDKETHKIKRKASITLETQIPESEKEDCPTLKAPQDLKEDEKAVVDKIDLTEAKNIDEKAQKFTTDSKTSRSMESFKINEHNLISLNNQNGEKYERDNHSNISYKKNQCSDQYHKGYYSNLSLKHPEDTCEKKYLKDNHSNQSVLTKQRKSNNFNYESEILKQASLKLEQYLKEKEGIQNEKIKLLFYKIDDSGDENDDFEVKKKNENVENVEGDDEEEKKEMPFFHKIALFFDLDLLKDFTFINLMLGITLANFNELNFSILTPFILGDYEKTKTEVALFMSLLAGIDICVRFCIPFVAGKIGWDNNSFFLLGVLSMAMGRVVLAFSQESWVVMIVAVIIGFGKGLRTVFMALIIPTHVPLHKLPGASGIQLITAGIAYLSLGPVVGWIKDNATTGQTLHCLNVFTWLTAFSWGMEKYIRSRNHNISKDESVNA